MTTVELSIPPRSAYVATIRLAMASLARKAGLGEESVDDLKIAVSEACANAVVSAEESGNEEPVTVVWTEQADRLTIEVGDRRADVQSDDSDVDTQGFSTRLTMSLALLESLVDEFKLTPRTGGGMCTTLVLYRRDTATGAGTI